MKPMCCFLCLMGRLCFQKWNILGLEVTMWDPFVFSYTYNILLKLRYKGSYSIFNLKIRWIAIKVDHKVIVLFVFLSGCCIELFILWCLLGSHHFLVCLSPCNLAKSSIHFVAMEFSKCNGLFLFYFILNFFWRSRSFTKLRNS